ncbi:MAG: hypothetical protein WB781_15445 [Candidatus Sulfotelmatobacter sp.]
MLTASESDAEECLCDILLREDRDMCPVHGTEAQEAKAREVQAARIVSVGRTQPLWEEPSESTALDEIWEMVEQTYFDGRITWRQRGLFRWAAQKAQAVESPVQSLDGVEEL